MPSEWTVDLVNATVALWDDSEPSKAEADRLKFVSQALYTFNPNPIRHPQR
jgi:hypothetical protein